LATQFLSMVNGNTYRLSRVVKKQKLKRGQPQKKRRYIRNRPATNVEMILNYIEVRLNRVADSQVFKPLKRGDMQKIRSGLNRIVIKFKKRSLTKRRFTAFDDELKGSTLLVMELMKGMK